LTEIDGFGFSGRRWPIRVERGVYVEDGNEEVSGADEQILVRAAGNVNFAKHDRGGEAHRCRRWRSLDCIGMESLDEADDFFFKKVLSFNVGSKKTDIVTGE